MARTTSSAFSVSLKFPKELGGGHHRYCSYREAEDLVYKGDVRRKRIPGRHQHTYELILLPDPSTSKPTPCGISAEDIEAYVGIGSRSRVMAIRAKIAELATTSLRHNAAVLA